MAFTRSEDLVQIEDAKKAKGPKGKPGASFAGQVARPLREGNPKKVGVLQRQKAAKTQANPQNVGGKKLNQGTENPTKTGWEAMGKKKQAQQVKKPAPKAIKRGR